MNLDYSPVLDESGQSAGVIAIVVETTETVLADRRIAAEQKRQRQLFSKMPGFVGVLAGKELAYDTTLATDARQALKELSIDARRLDIAFSDVLMPGMNGIELGQERRRRHPGLPVALASGYSHVLVQNGTDGFDLLHKPYSVAQLSRVLRKAALWRKSGRLP
jgi:CheY-like chemotaxis protein